MLELASLLYGTIPSNETALRGTKSALPSGKYDLISLQFGAIGEQQSMRLDLRDLLALFDFDLAINDKLTCSHVNA